MTLHLLPEGMARVMPVAVQLPLFVVCLLSIVVGMVIGYLLEWLREHKHRRRASQKAREAARLNARGRPAAQAVGPRPTTTCWRCSATEAAMRVKICGLRSRAEAAAAAAAGAAYIGLVRFPPSPRHLTPRRCALGGRSRCRRG